MPGNCQSHSDGMSAGCNQWRQLSYWKGFFCPQHIRCKMLIVSAMQPVTLTILLKQEQMRHGPRDKNTWARVTGQEEKCCLIHLLPLSNPSWGSLDMPICPIPPFLWISPKNQYFPIEKSWLCSDQAALPPSPPLSPTLSWLRRAERCSVHKPSKLVPSSAGSLQSEERLSIGTVGKKRKLTN